MSPMLSAFPRATNRQQGGQFEFATMIETAGVSAVRSEQPCCRASVGFVERVDIAGVLGSDHGESNDVGIAADRQRDGRTVCGVAFGRGERNKQRMTQSMRFGPHRIHVGIDRDVTRDIAQFSVMRVKSDRTITRVVGRNRLGGRPNAFGEQSQLLQQLIHAFGFRAQGLHRLIDGDVAMFNHVRSSTNRCDAIAQGMAYAA